jgi:hypothetical protein
MIHTTVHESIRGAYAVPSMLLCRAGPMTSLRTTLLSCNAFPARIGVVCTADQFLTLLCYERLSHIFAFSISPPDVACPALALLGRSKRRVPEVSPS